jgi:2-polyprenyl-3-methyl-5-hydroxy-6-metoxy-1,4-benzoquinol methylase
MEEKTWFKDWFDTKYYHLLYQNRNESEAENFIKNLTHFLHLENGAQILDLACGKGRHAMILHQLGFEVLGADLSENSINEAKKNEKDGLTFQVQDMREMIPQKQFDAVFNLFTSFGYFEDTSDNVKVIQAVFQMLKSKGILVIDFMNVHRVLDVMITEETKVVSGIQFELHRKYSGTHIIKEINFKDGEQNFSYQEKVQALKKEDFESLLQNNGFSLMHIFGDYNLNSFDKNLSDRLILIAQKNV